MARAHRGARGERLDAEVVPGVGGDPALEVAQTVALRRLRGELGAELRLVPRPSQEEHQPAGDGERGLVAEVVLDEREREVDARGDSGGGEDVAVTNEDRVGFDLNSRMTARECLARGPVSGRAPAVEEPGGGEHEGAGADRRHPAGVAGEGADAADELGVVGGDAGAVTACDDQGVERAAEGVEIGVGDELEAARGTHRHASAGRDHDPVSGVAAPALAQPPGRAREHLERPAHVEALHSGEADDHHAAGRHGVDPGSRRSCPQ